MSMMKEREKANQPEDTPRDAPRAFSRGLGFLLQGYGAAVLLLMGCLCAGIAFYEADAWQSGTLVAGLDTDAAAALGRRATTALLIGSALSAFCLVGCGVGMQADRGVGPAIGAGVTNVVMVLVYGWISWAEYAGGGGWWAVGIPGILVLFSAGLSFLSFAAISEVTGDPPSTSRAPVVPGEAFPDPWAGTKSADAPYDEPLKGSIAKQRARLRKQLDDLDELEGRLDGGASATEVVGGDDDEINDR